MRAFVERAHANAWAAVAEVPFAGALRDDRSTRVAVIAAIHVLGAFVLTGLAPLWLLLLGPLLLGVPHVIGDLRHLVLRPPRPIPRGLFVALAVPFGAMTALRAGSLAGFGSLPTLEIALGGLSIGVAALWGRGRPLLQVGIVATTAALLVPALLSPGHAALVLGHAHNVVALALWVAWAGPSPARWGVVALVAAAVATILGGALDPWVLRHGLEPAAGLDLDGLTRTLAPGLPAPWDLRVVLAFAMLQAVHYSMWVWCIPATPSFADAPGPETPWAAWRRWWRDLGPTVAIAAILGAIALPLAGLLAPTVARASYLSMVLFHGWLELAVAAHLIALSRAPR